MFQKKLFKRALPAILSVAMVFQSAPVTALAAEGNVVQVVEQITEKTNESESEPTKESSEPESESTKESSESGTNIAIKPWTL